MVALLLLLWVSFAGALLARRLDEASTRLVDTLALGTALGLAVFVASGFILGWIFGLGPVTVVAAALLTMGAGIALGAPPATFLSFARGASVPNWRVALLALFTVVAVTRLADQTLFEIDGGIATGDRHNFGDLPFHMAIAAGFAYGENFPPDHPELAGVRLTYPFFCDLLSGMILVVGGSWRDAFFWPTLLLGLAVVVALVRFGEAVTGSRALGRVGAALTLFSGGFGFLALSSADALARWWAGGPDLTINESGVRYANFIVTLFIPQRSILFGWPLLLFSLALLVQSFKAEDAGTRLRGWRNAGLIGSLLPLVHSHSFAVLGFCALFFAARADAPRILAFARGIIPLALPAVLFMATHNSLSTKEFFEWSPGFDGGAAGPLRYWLMNAGLFLPLVFFGATRAAAPAERAFALPFAALFIAANLFRLSPWIWDNMKFLAPAHAGLAPFAALALASLWKDGRAARTVAILAFSVASLSGALDISKVAMARGRYGIFDRTDFAFAAKVREATAPTATILTAPIHNHAVLLSGRRVFLGYEGHLWSQGLDYAARQPVAEALFGGASQASIGSSFIAIDAIALTPAELPLISDPKVFEGLPSLVESPYRLFKAR